MINAEKILKLFKRKNIDFVCGVPDSVLKPFSNLIENNKHLKHLIVVNEGSAVSLGIGFHLSTKKVPCIYLQNSGLSNAINPLASISHPKVYSIPTLILIGWRGSPGLKDEPQHIVKGLITKNKIKNKELKNIKSNECKFALANDKKGIDISIKLR